ncbi:sirohydrochlorin chelatase [Actinotalea sp. Marseille-Q4924]|uniref:sirohydrochlorin chelatase n=1 Tax=Actinotalea sp. Marseille-Q4924 TaxID=2866571 RepID=UPI001CE43154|nr:CbiX/SirB N-terminal domain-containing protein [Actinotalea sp. Marseille-Q4924]
MTGPVLVGCSHGTDDAAGRAAIAAILDGVRRRRPHLDVREAFVDVQQPEVADVVADAVIDRDTSAAGGDAGAGAGAVVVPLLLSAGFHTHVDVARAVAGVPGAVASGTLGPDERVVAVLADRLHEAGTRPGDAVVLAAAGSSDPRSSAAVEAVADALRRLWPHGPVTVGYGSAATPTVPEAVAAARADLGQDRGARGGRVVVASYLLAPGFFQNRVLRAGADVVTAPLAPDERLVDVVLDRYDCAAAAAAGACLPGRRCPVLGGCSVRADDDAGHTQRETVTLG